MLFRVHTFGLRELIDDLDRSHDQIDERVAKVAKASVDRIKNDAQRQVRVANYGTLPHLHRSFTSQLMQRDARQVVAEAGALHGAGLQGELDFILEYGSYHSSPHPHWRPAVERETPRWERELEDACAKDFDR